jgi:nucleoside-specific outer membrane channel protein Tsx
MRLRKKLLAAAMIAAIAVSFVAYAWATRDEGADAEKNQESPSDTTDNPSDVTGNSSVTDVLEFKAVVNGMRSVDVFVYVDTSDGLTKKEAELIAGTTFIQVMGEEVSHQLDTLTFDDTQIEAHYTWGHDENDMGHVFDMIADLTTLQIAVSHCF